MENKMTNAQFVSLASSVIGALALLLVAFGVLRPDAAAPADEATARGTTNFDDLSLSGDLTVGDDSTFTGDVTFSTAGSVDATEIANVSREINFPLRSFIDCQTDAGTDINFAEAVDTLPDFINSATDGTGFVLRFDDTGSSEDEGTEVCNQFSVPADYASGGAFIFRALKNAETSAESENISCAVSVNGGALQATGSITVTGATSASYTCSPTIATLAANDSVSFYFAILSLVGGAEAIDDTVDIASVKFRYTATQ